MLLVKNTMKNHWPIFCSTVYCCFQSVEEKYKIMVLHLGTASPPGWTNCSQQGDEVCGADTHPGEGRQHLSAAAAELGGSSNQPSQSSIIRKGNSYAKFNRLILTLTTGCRKIDRPFAMSASARSSCFRSGAALRPKMLGMVRRNSLPLPGHNSTALGD